MSPAFLPSFLPSDFPGEITLDQVIPGAAAEFAPLPPEMRPELAAALAARGIVRLYTHQADAYRAVRNGRHLVTASRFYSACSRTPSDGPSMYIRQKRLPRISSRS